MLKWAAAAAAGAIGASWWPVPVMGGPTAGVETCRVSGPALSIAPESKARSGGSAFAGAFERVVARSPEPEVTRTRLMARIAASGACYPGDLSQEAFEELIRTTHLLPPTQGAPTGMDPRFFADSFCWNGDGGQAQAYTSRRAALTYSFAADGTQWGMSCSNGNPVNSSTLDAALVAAYGQLDQGREYIRQGFAAWRRVGGLSYQEVGDNSESMNANITRSPDRGDIRVGGFALGISMQPLAYNAFPSTFGFSPTCAGGDMFINTSYFTAAYFKLGPSGSYRVFRNCAAHEHGHGLGLKHVVPCDETKLMEPVITSTVNLLTSDEVRGAIANYGDRFAGNHSFFSVKDFGSLTTPVVRSVLEPDLGVNGTVVFINNQTVLQDDYFRFSLSGTQTVTISVTPTGIAGLQGTQTLNCAGSTSSVDGRLAGHLQIEVLNSSQAVIASATAAPVGQPQTLTMSFPGGAAGGGTQYTVRVFDFGDAPQAQGNLKVQTYDLLIRVGGAPAPPQAIAGVNKLTRSGRLTYFMGNLLSVATESGATITDYSWDLDGNGSFETVGVAQPTITYVSNGVFNVTLRVTDSNGKMATDTITCTVTNATTSITGVSPASGAPGATVPVTITGTNLRQVTTLGQLSLSGSGITLLGTPVPDALGTQVTGVSLVIAAGAPGGVRNLTITNSDGQGSSGTGTGVFTVSGTPTGGCCGTNGLCTVQTMSACQGAGGTYKGDGTTCSPSPCPGACCAANGTCTSVTSAACTTAGGVYKGDGVSCGLNPCPQPAACCFGDGSCSLMMQTACGTAGGTFISGSTSCSPSNPCPQPGACCSSGGSCSSVVQTACVGGTFLGGTCSPSPCPQPTGACCTGSSCAVTGMTQCVGTGGTYKGNGTICTPSPCPPATGACCAGSSCAVMAQSACTGTFRRFTGDSIPCNGPNAGAAPCCKADFNQSSPSGTGGVTLQDLFDFLSAWFARDPLADFNASGTVSVQDLFDFLGAWFFGC